MNTSKSLTIFSRGFIYLSALSLLSVSLMAFASPQSVMDLVSVQLSNADAFSSIRGVYGGVGLSLSIGIIWLSKRSLKEALAFLTMFWGLYAVSRIITIFADGALGEFGSQWLTIEILFSIIGGTLFLFLQRSSTRRIAFT